MKVAFRGNVPHVACGRVAQRIFGVRSHIKLNEGRFYNFFKFCKCSLVADKRLRSGLKALQAQGNALGRLATAIAPRKGKSVSIKVGSIN